MATACVHICTQCEEDNISNEAERWCLECEEWLCTDCYKHHGKSKLLKQHKTITVHDYNILPPEVRAISNKCTQHGEKFERFCSVHGIPCCIQCITDEHKECTLRPLGEVLKNIKTSSAICNLEEDLITIKENFETITKHLTDKEVQVQKQKEQCLQEVRQLRKQLNDHLDVIEKRLTDEIVSEATKLQTKMAILDKEIKSRKAKIRQFLQELSKMKHSATDLQLFLVIRKTEKELSNETRFVEDLMANECKDEKALCVEFSPLLVSLNADITSFGNVTINCYPSTFNIKTARQDQAQMLISMPTRIDRITAKGKHTIQLPRGNMKGCAIFPDGRSVFADRSNMWLYNSDGVYVKEVFEFSDIVEDVCLVNDNLVITTFYASKKIIFHDLVKDKITNTIFLKSGPTGIDCNGDTLIVACPRSRTILITDLGGRIDHRIQTQCNLLARVAAWKNKIFCTDYKANKILCYDNKGTLIWIYESKLIEGPFGIAVDKSGFVYVAAQTSNKLFVITPDGDSGKELLDKNDGLEKVTCVSINRDRLLLCYRSSNNATIYSLKI